MQPGLEDLYRMIEGKPTSNSKLVSQIKKSMDSYRKTKEWRKHVMNKEEVAAVAKQEGKEEGKKEGLITGIYNLVSVLRDYGENNQGILDRLKQKYGKIFSEKELESFLKQS